MSQGPYMQLNIHLWAQAKKRYHLSYSVRFRETPSRATEDMTQLLLSNANHDKETELHV